MKRDYTSLGTQLDHLDTGKIKGANETTLVPVEL